MGQNNQRNNSAEIGKCNRYKECQYYYTMYSCHGCGYQHFDKILVSHPQIESLKEIGDEYFNLCSKDRKGPGGRIAIDKPFRKFIKEKFAGKLQSMESIEYKTSIVVKNEELKFKVKHDGAYKYVDSRKKEHFFFFEIKGYGDNSNDLLSAITASQILKKTEKFNNAYYFYFGISSGKSGKSGMSRSDNEGNPYIKWAESEEFLEFYGIVDIELLINRINGIISSIESN